MTLLFMMAVHVCVCYCVPVMCSVFECVKVSHWLWLVDDVGVGVATTYTSSKGEADSDQSYRTTQQPLRARRNQDHNQQEITNCVIS